MRIAHVLDSLEIGGAERLVASLCRHHAAAGHEIAVHALFGDGPLRLELEARGIRVQVHGPDHSLLIAAKLASSLRKAATQVVHCHNIASTVLGAPIGKLSNRATVVSTRHGLAPASGYGTAAERRYAFAAHFCDSVVAVTETAEENLRQARPAVRERLVTIRNCAPIDLPAPKRAGVRSQPFTFVSVARLSAAKDHTTLLRALHQAREQMPLRLVLVGDGPLRPELERITQELGLQTAVTFAGSQTDVVPFLRDADAFVLSSITEGLPLALLEAMACSLPAVVTKVGGMPEVVELSQAGFVVPPSSPTLLASVLLKVAQHPNISELGIKARSCYEQNFRPSQMAESYLKLYELQRN